MTLHARTLGTRVSVTLLSRILKLWKYLTNVLIRPDNISRLFSIYMATIKQKEAIVGFFERPVVRVRVSRRRLFCCWRKFVLVSG